MKENDTLTEQGGGLGLMLRGLLFWLPAAVGITLLSGLVYVAVQQNFRQGANDPQIAMAEDAAVQLEAGAPLQTVAGGARVDMARSLSPFLIVYDDAGNSLASEAVLDGQTPQLPSGVFVAVRTTGEDRLSWQPRPGVRSATVVTHYGGSKPGFVLAGRSLREVEKRESDLTVEVAGAWAVAMIGSLVASLLAAGVAGRILR
ncbi:MAG: hypothetical protein M3014_08435 [Chloroflexota bacterium]|nr:hypothetical protein [Chloroflexota bacterium]